LRASLADARISLPDSEGRLPALSSSKGIFGWAGLLRKLGLARVEMSM